MIDLSGLDHFRATGLLEATGAPAAPGEMDLDLIDFDSEQPRTQLDQQALQALAESIRQHGVLEPVSLRPHPERAGRFIVNRGERRCRASRLAGLRSVPYFLDERLDRFAQAVENLQREDLSPFDLARFIAAREREGLSRAEIARRLQLPASTITEVAALLDAPAPVRAAFDAGRARDTRMLYLLVRAWPRQPAVVQALLDSDDMLTRASVERALAEAATPPSPPLGEPAAPVPTRATPENPPARTPAAALERTAPRREAAGLLLVEYGGRRGRLDVRRQPSAATGEVVFDDGRTEEVALGSLRLVQWIGR